MKEAKLTNPFPIVGYYGATYFCDREKETSQLISSIKNGSSTTLMSIRRIGKTGLIYHTFSQLSSDYKSIYIDILATENLSEFLNTLTTSILQAVSPKSSIGNRFWKFIQSLRPIITFDTFSGAPQVTFNIVSKDVERSIKSVLEFLDGQG
ncbi:MAG: ATP-binding protein, partial [Bacteroidales bacterium]